MKILFSSLKILFILMITTACSNSVPIYLPAIFSDNMVLQQDKDVAIWGTSRPGVNISVSASWGQEAKTVVAPDSTWQLQLTTAKAGGPHYIHISAGKSSVTINDVYLGEVWLASGQSNMEMPLAGWPPEEPILHSDETIANANYPLIRMFTVAREASPAPLTNVSGRWEVASPATAGQFSATAFFFARELHQKLGIPVGIIHSSWGGTPAESWVSGQKLAGDIDFQEIVNQLEATIPEEIRYQEWLKEHLAIDIEPREDGADPLAGLDIFNDWASNPGLSADNWQTINLPAYIETTSIGQFDGVIWFRKTVIIPADWNNQELVLSLGPVDDRDVTWFNGYEVGATDRSGAWQQERLYTIPANLVRYGPAVIAVRVTDTTGGGGIYGNPASMRIFPVGQTAQSISLAGEWQYKIVGEISGGNLFLFDPMKRQFDGRPSRTLVVSQNTPSALYNGMIAPLVPYTLRGVIWYQGESNVGRANQYTRLKNNLIDDWRNKFMNPELPFYYVQIAPWRYDGVDAESSANLREAQRRLMTIPNTGMAVTLDVGDIEFIHPANKMAVGERLAAWALAHQYDKDVPYSGPLPIAAETYHNQLRVSFSHANDGLVISANIPGQFEIAGGDGIFFPAQAKIEDNNTLVLQAPGVDAPKYARYAFRNGSVATLFNLAGLPAPSFSTLDIIAD